MILAAPDLLHLLLLPAVGAVAGLLGGLLGIGGGIIMIPAMLYLLPAGYGPNALHLFKLSSLLTTIVLAIPAAIRHGRAGAIVRSIVVRATLLALLGVGAGVILSSVLVDDLTHILRRVFGVFMLLVAAAGFLEDIVTNRNGDPRQSSSPAPQRWGPYGCIVGLPAGLIAGLLGVGGGIWAVPAQTLLLGVRVRNAIANSTCMVVVLAMAATIGQTLAVSRMSGIAVSQGAWLALWLAPGAIAGGWWGAWLAHRLKARWLRYGFLALLGASGVQLALF